MRRASGCRRGEFNAKTTGNRADKVADQRSFAYRRGPELDGDTRIGSKAIMDRRQCGQVPDLERKVVQADIRAAIEWNGGRRISHAPQRQHRRPVRDKDGGVVGLAPNHLPAKRIDEEAPRGGEVRNG